MDTGTAIRIIARPEDAEPPGATRPFGMDQTVHCRRCGADLRGLPRDGDCPGCGEPLSVALRPAGLEEGTMRELARRRRALRLAGRWLVVGALCITAGELLAAAEGPGTLIWAVRDPILLVGLLINAAGTAAGWRRFVASVPRPVRRAWPVGFALLEASAGAAMLAAVAAGAVGVGASLAPPATGSPDLRILLNLLVFVLVLPVLVMWGTAFEVLRRACSASSRVTGVTTAGAWLAVIGTATTCIAAALGQWPLMAGAGAVTAIALLWPILMLHETLGRALHRARRARRRIVVS